MERREFVGSLGAVTAGALVPASGLAPSPAGEGVEEWRRHFPALSQEVNGRPLVYLDTAATSLRPRQVIDAIARFYETDNANPGGALHTLARRANDAYEGARKTVAKFIGAGDPAEVIFTRGTTDAINLVAAAWGGATLRPGDEILIGIAEHASNMLPWQMVARRTGAVVRYFAIDDEGRPVMGDLVAQLTTSTRIVAFSHVSNVLGIINPAQEMVAAIRAARPECLIVIDGAQSVPHIAIDVRALDCDFMAFSSHKMLGPMGVGVLWGKRARIDAMPPYQGGSNMAHDIDLESLVLSDAALKFGAGSPNVSGPVGLAAAMTFLDGAGRAEVWRHEQEITRQMLARLSAMRRVRVIGTTGPDDRIGVFALAIDGLDPLAALRALDLRGIAVRAGDMAALPLFKRFGVTRALRASCYLYTTAAEVDAFADALERVV